MSRKLQFNFLLFSTNENDLILESKRLIFRFEIEMSLDQSQKDILNKQLKYATGYVLLFFSHKETTFWKKNSKSKIVSKLHFIH
jgi:hypothetical protein